MSVRILLVRKTFQISALLASGAVIASGVAVREVHAESNTYNIFIGDCKDPKGAVDVKALAAKAEAKVSAEAVKTETAATPTPAPAPAPAPAEVAPPSAPALRKWRLGVGGGVFLPSNNLRDLAANASDAIEKKKEGTLNLTLTYMTVPYLGFSAFTAIRFHGKALVGAELRIVPFSVALLGADHLIELGGLGGVTTFGRNAKEELASFYLGAYLGVNVGPRLMLSSSMRTDKNFNLADLGLTYAF